MNKVDRAGTFRGIPIEYGVATTKNNFPTFNVVARLTEYYDEESNEWIDWSGYEQEVTCFLCLFGYNGKTKELAPTANHAQVMKIFDWNGESFAELADGDYTELGFQIKIAPNDPEWAERNPFTVAWVDDYDADPVRQLKKLDIDGLKDLDKTFAPMLKKSAKAKTAVSAPKTAPAAPPKTPKIPPKKAAPPQDTDEETVVADDPAEKKRKLLEKSKKNLAAAAKDKEAAPPSRTKKATTPPPPATESIGSCTKQEAWMAIVELKKDDIDDTQLGEIWNATIDEVSGDTDPTPQQWVTIREAVLDQVAKF